MLLNYSILLAAKTCLKYLMLEARKRIYF